MHGAKTSLFDPQHISGGADALGDEQGGRISGIAQMREASTGGLAGIMLQGKIISL
jgi:hypothetical protein